jgi:truncated hemoglobin YjbI
MTVVWWTLLTFLIMAAGTIFAAFDVRDTWRSRRAIQLAHRPKTGLVWIVAHGNFRTEVLCFGVLASFTLVVAMAMTIEVSELRQILVRIGLIGGASLLTIRGIFNRRDRRQIGLLQVRAPMPEIVPGSDLSLLGGVHGLEQIVADLYARLLRDDLLGRYFRGIRVARLIHAQTEWLTGVLAGHPSLLNLQAVHAPLNISPEEFARFLDLCRETLADFDVAPDLQERIIHVLLSTRDQIVTRTQP